MIEQTAMNSRQYYLALLEKIKPFIGPDEAGNIEIGMLTVVMHTELLLDIRDLLLTISVKGGFTPPPTTAGGIALPNR